MEALVVVEEVLVWTNETSVGEEGKGSEWNQGARWAPIQTTTWRGVYLFSFFLINQVGAHPNNNMEGSRLVLILPHQSGGHPSKQQH